MCPIYKVNIIRVVRLLGKTERGVKGNNGRNLMNLSRGRREMMRVRGVIRKILRIRKRKWKNKSILLCYANKCQPKAINNNSTQKTTNSFSITTPPPPKPQNIPLRQLSPITPLSIQVI